MSSEKKPLILAVDDEPVNLFLLNEMLSDQYRVVTVDNGFDALKMLETELPDLILLDISMPGIDGFQVCKSLKSKEDSFSIPVIFLTALDSEAVELEGFEVGAVDFITKPFSELKLLARIKTHIELSHAKKAIQVVNNQFQFERNLMDSMVEKMRHDKLLDLQFLSPFMKSFELNNGDILLSSKSANGKQFVILGDFTGHGLPAALCGQMAMCLFYRDAKKSESIEEILHAMNKEFIERLPSQVFMAAAAIELDPESRQVRFVNCGLPSCFLFNQTMLDQIDLSSQYLPLGILDTNNYAAVEFELQDAAALVMHTDGLVETSNEYGEHFGLERLEQAIDHILKTKKPLSDLEIVLKAFAKDGIIYDDLSLVAVQF